METLTFCDALANARRNRRSRTYPSKTDRRHRNLSIFPTVYPKFQIAVNRCRSIFAIGSCFARHIEDEFEDLGIHVPTKQFTVPKSEWPNSPSCLLNEYNPGSISQKIIWTLDGIDSPVETIYKYGGAYHDLLLCGGSGVEYTRAIARRTEIANIYSYLRDAELVFITLGFVECWFDQETNSWLNRMPPLRATEKPGARFNRFVLKRLGVDDAMSLFCNAFERLASLRKKVILTVSPVPLASTFVYRDCVIANEYSKSVLRVCAEKLSGQFQRVDYYPSYEIVRAAGLPVYEDDHVQVRQSLVKEITKDMIRVYSGNKLSAQRGV